MGVYALRRLGRKIRDDNLGADYRLSAYDRITLYPDVE